MVDYQVNYVVFLYEEVWLKFIRDKWDDMGDDCKRQLVKGREKLASFVEDYHSYRNPQDSDLESALGRTYFRDVEIIVA